MSDTKKVRLDLLLVERGLFPTRAKAQAALMAGKVVVPGRPNPKAGMELDSAAPLEVKPDACPFVSRGGLKLAAALERFGLRVAGRVALDVGASTGGFTDCLLQRGAARVYAVDVGRGQIDAKLRADPRVSLFEGLHAKNLQPGAFQPRPDLATVDVSFISLTSVLAPVAACLAAPADLVVLVKPQFEVGPKLAPKGIVRSAEARARAVEKVRLAAEGLGLAEAGLLESPLKGAKGNVEFLLWLTPRSPSRFRESLLGGADAGRGA